METMQPTVKHVDGFTVTGFKVRTKNSDEFNETKAKLPKLWQQFHKSSLTTKPPIFGVYSDYESDANGLYTVTAGVESTEHSPGLSSIIIKPGNYLVFQGRGEMPLAVIETWGRVWNYFTHEKAYQRSFLTDFEVYTGMDEIAIYIGIQ